jgi:hypothetical protein
MATGDETAPGGDGLPVDPALIAEMAALGEDAAAARHAELAAEIEEDRDALLAVMDELDVTRDLLKVGSAWVAEKVGRLKLNGSLFSYSPLSRLVELEGLYLGVTGKLSMWENVKTATPGGASSVDFDELIARAESQRARLEDLRTRAAAEAF